MKSPRLYLRPDKDEAPQETYWIRNGGREIHVSARNSLFLFRIFDLKLKAPASKRKWRVAWIPNRLSGVPGLPEEAKVERRRFQGMLSQSGDCVNRPRRIASCCSLATATGKKLKLTLKFRITLCRVFLNWWRKTLMGNFSGKVNGWGVFHIVYCS